MQPTKKGGDWLPDAEASPFFKDTPSVANGNSFVCYPIVLFIAIVASVTLGVGAQATLTAQAQCSDVSKERRVRESILAVEDIRPLLTFPAIVGTRSNPKYRLAWQDFYAFALAGFDNSRGDAIGDVWLAPGDLCVLLHTYTECDFAVKKPFHALTKFKQACNNSPDFKSDYTPESHILVPTTHRDLSMLMATDHCMIKYNASDTSLTSSGYEDSNRIPITDMQLRHVCFLGFPLQFLPGGPLNPHVLVVGWRPTESYRDCARVQLQTWLRCVRKDDEQSVYFRCDGGFSGPTIRDGNLPFICQ